MIGRLQVLEALVAALAEGSVEVVDLSHPLSDRTPVIDLPEPFVNTPGFTHRELSRYDEAAVVALAPLQIEFNSHGATVLDRPAESSVRGRCQRAPAATQSTRPGVHR